ncbi:hypothetical protein FR742_14885 [Nonomuraea sp. C10]|nr:hypothetical protein [Nonomuraea sp. C10]TXK40704.1 hypothetical protein FR742_14885 [Nonomuraea sp. C10]
MFREVAQPVGRGVGSAGQACLLRLEQAQARTEEPAALPDRVEEPGEDDDGVRGGDPLRPPIPAQPEPSVLQGCTRVPAQPGELGLGVEQPEEELRLDPGESQQEATGQPIEPADHLARLTEEFHGVGVAEPACGYGSSFTTKGDRSSTLSTLM